MKKITNFVSVIVIFVIYLIFQINKVSIMCSETTDNPSYSVIISPTNFSVEQQNITVNWTAPSNHNYYDEIMWMYINSDGNEKMIEYAELYSSATSGYVIFNQVPYSGTYFAQYLARNDDNNVVATSNNVTATFEGYSITMNTTHFSVAGSVNLLYTLPTNRYPEYENQVRWYFIDEEDGSQQLITTIYLHYYTTSYDVLISGQAIPYQGSYIAKLITAGHEVAATSQIGVSNFDDYSVIIKPAQFGVSTSASVIWSAPIGHSYDDVIQWLFMNDTSNHEFVIIANKTVSGGVSSGNVVFSGSSEISKVGLYVAKYITFANEEAAVSNAGIASFRGYKLNIVPSNFSVETSTTIEWSAPTGHSNTDEINWYYLHENGTKELISNFLPSNSINPPNNGTIEVDSYSIPHVGSYEAQYIINDDQIVATSNIGNSTTAGYEVSIPDTFEVELSVSVNWYAPAGHSEYDHIAWYYLDLNKPILMSTSVIYSTQISGNVKFNVPYIGKYIAKYIIYSDQSVVATSNVGISNSNEFFVHINPSQFYTFGSTSIEWIAPLGHESTDSISWYHITDHGGETLLSSFSLYSYLISGVIDVPSSLIPYNGTYVAKYILSTDHSVAAVSNNGTAIAYYYYPY